MKNVLLIVDDVVLSNEIMNALRIDKFHPIAANNYREGIRLVESQYPDVIVTDLDVFQDQSYDLLKQIRELTTVNQIPIIILHEQINKEFCLKVFQLGLSLFLEKTAKTDVLIRMIQSEITQKI
jgi:DNA-binding NarL/FixJ family response regulator